MYPWQLLLLRQKDREETKALLVEAISHLLKLATSIQHRSAEVLLRYPRLHSLLYMVWSIALRLVRYLLYIIGGQAPGQAESTESIQTNSCAEVKTDLLEEDACSKAEVESPCWKSSGSCEPSALSDVNSPVTSATSVGDFGHAEASTEDSPRERPEPKCVWSMLRRSCDLPSVPESEYCSLHQIQFCPQERERCGLCGVVTEDRREMERHRARGCRGDSDVAGDVTEKKYYSQDCNSGPMLCVADSGEACPTGDPQWQEKILRCEQEYNDLAQRFAVHTTNSLSPVKRQIQLVEAVVNRVFSIVEKAASQGVSDFLLVEYQFCDVTLSLSLGELIVDSPSMPRNFTVTFVLTAEEKNQAVLEGASEAIRCLHPHFIVVPIFTNLKDLCVDDLFDDLAKEHQCIVAYSTHLCGANVDLAMRSLSRSQGCTEERCGFLVATSCCHYLLEWSHFVGRAPWMRHFSLTHTDFLGCVEASSWARFDNAAGSHRQAVGRAAIKLLDAARLIALKEADDYSVWPKRKIVWYEMDHQSGSIFELLVDDDVVRDGDRDCS